MTVALYNRLLEVRMQWRFHACQESRAKQNSLCAEGQRRDKTPSVGKTSCGEYRNWSDRVDDHGNKGHAAHPAHVTTALTALGDDDICPSFRRAHRLLNRSRHIGDFTACLVGTVEIRLELLVGSSPGELHDGGAEIESCGEAVLARVEQKKI